MASEIICSKRLAADKTRPFRKASSAVRRRDGSRSRRNAIRALLSSYVRSIIVSGIDQLLGTAKAPENIVAVRCRFLCSTEKLRIILQLIQARDSYWASVATKQGLALGRE